MTQMVALLIGAVFGGGLYLAGMTNPSKIVNFLDIAGTWDPSLIFVMGGGIPVAAIGFFILKKREKPLIFDEIQVPTHGVIDRPLVIGSVLFGVGWGVSGLCPGPAFASVLLEPAIIIPYLMALILGSLAYDRIQR
ncbi:MAG: DUF6691 family protein [Litorivicinaceae bacterium]|jgi:uncharacterized membrane protein YedE/YeeE